MFTAIDCTNPYQGPKYPFGVNNEVMAKRLEEFAQKLRDGKIVLQRVITTQLGEKEDYAFQRIMIHFAERTE